MPKKPSNLKVTIQQATPATGADSGKAGASISAGKPAPTTDQSLVAAIGDMLVGAWLAEKSPHTPKNLLTTDPNHGITRTSDHGETGAAA